MTPQPASSSIIRFEAADIGYEDKKVLSGVSFQIEKGEFAYLIGRTGGGKSSLLKTIYADLRPQSGQIFVDKYAIHNLKKQQIPHLRRRLGIVFQDYQLLSDRDVANNIIFAMKATGWRDKKKIQQRLTEVLMQVGLSSKINHKPHQLSGGEQQRTVIARALVNDPSILVADEPTGNLDPEVAEHVMDILRKINRGGTAVLMATHQLELIKRYPARVLECADGKIIPRPG